MAGQSNGLGAGVGHDKTLDAPHPKVHQLAGSGRNEGKILVGEHPFWHHTRAPGVGFGQTFGKLHTESTGRPVLLVPAARGESGFHPHGGYTWDRKDATGAINLYKFAARQLSIALSGHSDNVLRGILWHQGEADTWHLNEHQYAMKLDALIAGFRGEFGAAPFILGQMSPDRMAEGNEGYPLIDAAHRDTPARVPLAAFVEAPHGLFNSPEDKLHFSAEGQRELGRRYYAEYRRLTARSCAHDREELSNVSVRETAADESARS
ncbi:sialate O-acetylesterase [Arthrobacter sp. 2RAF22]|uniref:sialate O-acetylesterase n=1 Tax=Arthrobacter sp. 2RAF22 TaxID=3232996 RepID=UPI003F90F1C6